MSMFMESTFKAIYRGCVSNTSSPLTAASLPHIRRMDFPIIIIRVSPLSFVGASGVIFKFYSFSR